MTLWAQQLACTRGDRVLFDGLDFEVHRGAALRVNGNNGSGKTSLLRMLSGLTEPTRGVVSWDSEDIRSRREQYHRRLTYLGHLPGVKEDLTVCENVMLATRLSGNCINRAAAVAALRQIGLGAQINLPTRVLSQGQKKRVALARLPFSSATPLWILDEPLVALDQEAIGWLSETINRHLDNRGMIVYSTHQEISLNVDQHLTVNLVAPC